MLTPLEFFFVEEFCRIVGISAEHIDQLRVLGRHRNPVGFMTEIDHDTVPQQLRWSGGVFDTLRVAVVGPEGATCGSLLFFDKTSGLLDQIEGYVYGEKWPETESPVFWSETERVGSGLHRQN